MSDLPSNKYRAAVEVLLRGRDQMVDALADEILDQSEDLIANGYAFHELLEGQGTRLHFLSLLLSQLEMCADQYDELQAASKPPAPKKRRSRSRKVQEQASKEGTPGD